MDTFSCYVVFVLENTEEEVLSANDGAFEDFGLEIGDLQDFLGLFDQRDVARRPSRLPRVWTNRPFNKFSQLLQVTIEAL